MPIYYFYCGDCGNQERALNKSTLTCPQCGIELKPLLTAPQVTYLEPRDSEDPNGKSVMKGQDKILLERSKAHSRDNELNDFVQEHGEESAKANGWVNQNGVVRKRIDEI